MICEILLDNVLYKIMYPARYIKNGDDEPIIVSLWKPLVIALWSKMTDIQKQKVVCTHPYNNNHKVINFRAIIQCYEYNHSTNIKFATTYGKAYLDGNYNEVIRDYNYFGTYNRCSCGVPITHQFIIMNISSAKNYIIGCDCIKWWNVSKKKLNIIKLLTQNIKECKDKNLLMPIHCSFCFKKKECLDCETKKNARYWFYNWKEYATELKKKKLNNLLEKNWNRFKKWLHNEYLQKENSDELLSKVLERINTNEFLPDYLKSHYKYFKFRMLNDNIYDRLLKADYKWKYETKIYLRVKYENKDDAKALGGKFDFD
jgi:hypothetical protein